MIMRPVRILSLSSIVSAPSCLSSSACSGSDGNFGASVPCSETGRNLPKPSGLKTLDTDVQVQLLQRVDRHAASEPRGDDRSGRSSADEIEIVAEQRTVAEPLFDRGLYDLEKLKG